jgi:predicted molibdopterin-dependent oxidoreductase YjgC
MDASAELFGSSQRLVEIDVCGTRMKVPDGNVLLRALQYVAAENIAYGRFCWNQDCQYCLVQFDMGEGTPSRKALACKTMVEDGMRVTELSVDLRWCLREQLK